MVWTTPSPATPDMTVIVPVLLAAPVFSLMAIEKLPSPEPIDLEGFSQDAASLDTFHASAFVLICTVLLLADASVSSSEIDSVSDTPFPCMTVIFFEIPPHLTVTAPVLANPVFAVAVKVIAPSPVPLEGDTFSHDVLLFAVHNPFDATSILVLPTVQDESHVVFDISSSVSLLPPPVSVVATTVT